MQKILHSLQKISPESRCIWGAFVTALLIHLFLMLLFDHTPAQNSQNSGELPKVGSIVLSDASNAELVVWMKNHDPSIMTVPDKVLGYSLVLGAEKQRSEPEDLPNIVQPVTVPKAVAADNIRPLDPVSRGVLYEPFIAQKNNLAARQTAVTINGEYSAEAADILTLLLRENAGQLPSGGGKITDTGLELQPERIPGTGARVVLIRSCGNEILDKIAQNTMYKYLLTGPVAGNFYGRIFFSWSNIKNIPADNKERKI